MTDAAHNQHSENQHSETRRPSDRDRIVTTGPSRFPPARPEVLPEMMSVSVAGIQKNRCRTTIAERMVETRAELPFTGDQIGLFRAQPGRPALSALQFGAIHPHEFFLMHVLPKSFHRSAGTLIISITYNAISQNRSNCFLKPTIAIKTRKEPGNRAQLGEPHARRWNGHVHGSIEQPALVLPVRHTRRQRAIQKVRLDLGIVPASATDLPA